MSMEYYVGLRICIVSACVCMHMCDVLMNAAVNKTKIVWAKEKKT